MCSTLQPHVSVLTLSVRFHPDDTPPLRSDITTRSLRVSCDRLTEVKPGDRTRWSEVCRPPSCSKHRESGTRQRVRTTRLLIHSGGVAAIFPEVSGHNVCRGQTLGPVLLSPVWSGSKLAAPGSRDTRSPVRPAQHHFLSRRIRVTVCSFLCVAVPPPGRYWDVTGITVASTIARHQTKL